MKIWKPVMEKYFQQIPRTGFSQPPRKIQVGKQVKVPSLSGMSVSAATRKLERLASRSRQYIYHDKVPKYGFIGWSPSPGSWTSEFGMVYAVYSNGLDPAKVAAEKARKKRGAGAKEEEAGSDSAALRSSVLLHPVDSGSPASARPQAPLSPSRGRGPRKASAGELAPDLCRNHAAVCLALGLWRHLRHDLAHGLHAKLGCTGRGDGAGDNGGDLVLSQLLRQVVGQHVGLRALLGSSERPASAYAASASRRLASRMTTSSTC